MSLHGPGSSNRIINITLDFNKSGINIMFFKEIIERIIKEYVTNKLLQEKK